MTRFVSRAFLPFSLAVLAASSAYADVAFNDFGTDDTFQIGTGWTIAGPTQGAAQDAFQFTSATSGTLTSVTIALSYSAGTNMMNVSLLSDNGSDQLGSTLESWSLSNLPNFGSGFAPEILTSNGSVSLTSGTKYWVLATPGGPDTLGAWNFNNQGVTGLKASSSDSGSSYLYSADATDGAFRVETTPVPEPATLSVLCLGVLGLLKRRKKA